MILHIAKKADVAAGESSGCYSCASLKSEGFIHCCEAGQLAGVVERYYTAVPDLLLLRIETAKLTAKLVYENTVGGEELFAHIYGVINMDAVAGIEPLNAAVPR